MLVYSRSGFLLALFTALALQADTFSAFSLETSDQGARQVEQ